VRHQQLKRSTQTDFNGKYSIIAIRASSRSLHGHENTSGVGVSNTLNVKMTAKKRWMK
jgi:hypothetical protein